MYEEHPVFIQPENEEIKVWRYMDFAKLVSLIDTRRLYFARADNFEDPFEGSWTKLNVEMRKNIFAGLPIQQQFNLEDLEKNRRQINEHFPRCVAMNCWHMNEQESAAMWKIYLKSDEGIAIQSTYSRLKKSLIDDEKIYLGKVRYIDYDKEYISPTNVFMPFSYKRLSFEHEREVRAVVIKWPLRGGGFDFEYEVIPHGLNIKIDIEELIERIYIAPSTPDWFADLVRAVISRYGYNFEVVHSRLNENPVF